MKASDRMESQSRERLSYVGESLLRLAFDSGGLAENEGRKINAEKRPSCFDFPPSIFRHLPE